MRPCASPLRHLLVQDAAAGRHPLHVAGAEAAAVAEAVAVLDGPGEHVGDRLDAAVRMPREPGEIVVRVRRCGSRRRAGTDRTPSVSPKPNARCSFTPAPSTRRLRLQHFPDRSNRHGRSPLPRRMRSLSAAAGVCAGTRRSARLTRRRSRRARASSRSAPASRAAPSPTRASSEYAPYPVNASATAPVRRAAAARCRSSSRTTRCSSAGCSPRSSPTASPPDRLAPSRPTRRAARSTLRRCPAATANSGRGGSRATRR